MVLNGRTDLPDLTDEELEIIEQNCQDAVKFAAEVSYPAAYQGKALSEEDIQLLYNSLKESHCYTAKLAKSEGRKIERQALQIMF